MSLELKSVSVMRGKARILKDISGRLEPGQIVGLIGPNGTGKSTLVNAIATLYPFGGTIHWKGRPVKLGEIGYMPCACRHQRHRDRAAGAPRGTELARRQRHGG